MLNLDTHILLYALQGELTRSERNLLSRETWGISAIVLWEIEKLHELGRISIGLDDSDFGRALSGLVIWPLTIEVCRAIRKLDIESDPADEIIAATSLITNAPLVTRDRRLNSSRILPLALK